VIDEPILREKAREAIRSGKLPMRAPDRTFGGPGVNQACAVCGEAIPRDDMEFEIEFSCDGVTAGADVWHLHPMCFIAWEFERTAIDGRVSVGGRLARNPAAHGRFEIWNAERLDVHEYSE
jgi:hypothetical protein